MVEFFRSLAQILFLGLDSLPMPTRPMVLVLVVSLGLQGLLRFLIVPFVTRIVQTLDLIMYLMVSLLILPEYWLISRYRRGRQPLPSVSFFYGDGWSGFGAWFHILQQWLTDRVATLRLPLWLIVLLLLLIGGAWTVQSSLASTTLGRYIANGFSIYEAVENRWRVAVTDSATSLSPPPVVTPPAVRSTLTPTLMPTRQPTATTTSVMVEAVTYTVQPGDSLHEIATRFDVTVDAIVVLNQETYPSLTTDPRRISVGWVFLIPAPPP